MHIMPSGFIIMTNKRERIELENFIIQTIKKNETLYGRLAEEGRGLHGYGRTDQEKHGTFQGNCRADEGVNKAAEGSNGAVERKGGRT